MSRLLHSILACVCAIALAGAVQSDALPASPSAGPPEVALASSLTAISGIALVHSRERIFAIDYRPSATAPRGSAGTDAFMDAYDARSLQRISRIAICPIPHFVAANDYTQRVIVVCMRLNAIATSGASDSTLVIVDASSLNIVARKDLAGTALFAMSAGHSPYGYALAKNRLMQIDTRTGSIHQQSTGADDPGADYERLSVSGATTDRVTLYSERSATTIQIGSSAIPVRRDFGRQRYPTDSVSIDGFDIFALGGAGTLVVSDSSRRTKRVPICDMPVELFASADARQLTTLCSPFDSPVHVDFVASDIDGANARTLRLQDLPDGFPFSPDGPRAAQDPLSGRFAIMGRKSVHIVNASEAFENYEVACPGTATELALDDTSGDVFVSFSNDDTGGLLRFNIRSGKPVRIVLAKGADPQQRSDSSLGIFSVLALGVAPELPARLDPPGIRSPAQLAALQDGTLLVRELLSPAIGHLTRDAYTNELLPIARAPSEMVAGRDGRVWFAEVPDGDRIVFARREPDGRLTEFPTSVGGGLGNLVASADGLYWLSFYSHHALGYISYSGQSREVRTLANFARTSGDGFPLGIAGDRAGGVWILVSSRLEHVDASGQVKNYPLPGHLFWESDASGLFELDGGRVAITYGRRLVVRSNSGAMRIFFPALGLPAPARSKTTRIFTWHDVKPRPRCDLRDVTSGPDNSIWGVCENTIVEIDVSGKVKRHHLPFEQSGAASLLRDRDGSMWFVETTQSKIGRISPDGILHEIAI